ncbi:hypothetical protein Ancab_004350 [Ancistrocladus abbreviatus]
MVQSKSRKMVRQNVINGVEAAISTAKSTTSSQLDHWAFLEDIEAPMWADLIEESKAVKENHDDKWFHTSHLFHQCSATQLRSAFAHSVEGSDVVNVNLPGISSPMLPSSVSKSRGKDYRLSNWGKDVNHPVKDFGSKSLRWDAGSIQEYQHKESCTKTSGATSSKSSLICDSSLTGIASASSKVTASPGYRKGGLSFMSMTASEGNITSIVTTESDQQQHPCILETSKQAFGQASGLLSALRISLRKSCAIRPALRVEINDDGETKGLKSSSGKSSMGDSSNNGNESKKNMLHAVKQNKDRAFNREFKGSNSSSGKSSVGSSTNLEYKVKNKVAIKGNKDVISGTELKGRKSSSGKSSMDSSLNLGYKVKNMVLAAKQKKDGTSTSSKLVKTGQATNRLNAPKMKKESSIQGRNVVFKSRLAAAAIVGTSTNEKATKSKGYKYNTTPQVSLQTQTSESLRVNAKNQPSAAARANKKSGQ